MVDSTERECCHCSGEFEQVLLTCIEGCGLRNYTNAFKVRAAAAGMCTQLIDREMILYPGPSIQEEEEKGPGMRIRGGGGGGGGDPRKMWGNWILSYALHLSSIELYVMQNRTGRYGEPSACTCSVYPFLLLLLKGLGTRLLMHKPHYSMNVTSNILVVNYRKDVTKFNVLKKLHKNIISLREGQA